MSRDFLIQFRDNTERDFAYNKLSKIMLNNQILFGVLDLRNNSIFATLTYRNKIKKDDNININGKKIKILDNVVFVALKNGEHDGNGYLFVDGEITKNFKNSDQIKITEIKNNIKSFFINKLNE